MSLLFFKRVLANPVRVGYIVPSSRFLTHRTAKLIDYSKASTVVELGPGEGCHSRRIARRMKKGSKLILIELDEHFAAHLEEQFAGDERVSVIHANALHLQETLSSLGISDPDYIVSGIPFTIMERTLREKLLTNIAHSMGPNSRFITYQATVQISTHELFDLVRREHCLFNVPPLHVMELRKSEAALAL
jgi:phosphatidylethanolamine/phosphatidyl-N-methylethanolamine N-methyltransferase